jgi:hypothetical protein
VEGTALSVSGLKRRFHLFVGKLFPFWFTLPKMEFTQPTSTHNNINTNNNNNNQIFTPQFAQTYNPAEDDEDESDEGAGRKKSKGPGRRRIEIGKSDKIL